MLQFNSNGSSKIKNINLAKLTKASTISTDQPKTTSYYKRFHSYFGLFFWSSMKSVN